MEPDSDMTVPGRGASGALGGALADAIDDYQRCLARVGRAQAAYQAAQRDVSEARARLTALTVGARVTASRALVVVPASDDDARAATDPTTDDG